VKTIETSLTDSENWTPNYESVTVPTASRLSPVLILVLLATAPNVSASYLEEETQMLRAPAIGFFPTPIPSFDERMTNSDTLVLHLENYAPDISDPFAVREDTESGGQTDSTLSLVALSRAAFPDSRPMKDWEKKATDEYFMSLFK
jgi:hypothetical protein